MLTANICLVSGILFFVYYIGLIVYAGLNTDFSLFWLAVGIALTTAGLLLRKLAGTGMFFRFRLAVWIAAGLLLLFLLLPILDIVKAAGNRNGRNQDAAFMVVLGAQVRGDRPSRALMRRIEAAARYADAHPDTVLILSGGKGPDEDISEAECMRRTLASFGIAEDRMILEERSTSTEENLIFSDELTGCSKENTVIATNDFHVYRSCAIARRLGYEEVSGIPAASDIWMQPHYMVREAFAIWYYRLRRRI